MKQIQKYRNQIDKIDKEVERLEEQLKKNKLERDSIIKEKLPLLLEEYGITEIKCDDGASLKLVTTYHGRISKENEEEAFKWLRDNNFGDVIKESVSLRVHPQTLKSIIQESMEKNIDFPYKLLGAYTERSVKIKEPLLQELEDIKGGTK